MGAAAASRIDTGICVIGGGPAGSVIARRLAELGHATLLVERGEDAAGPRVESLAPSIVPILESLGLSGVLDDTVFCRERHALVLWGTDRAQTKVSDPPSLLIERTSFDRRLREEAARMGARVMTPASARPPQRNASGGWTVAVTTPYGLASIAAEFLIDARGKRRGTSCDNEGPRTMSLSAVWRRDGAAPTETRIEAAPDEWFWGSPLPGDLYAAAVFVDSSRAAGLRGDARRVLYRRLLSQSELLKQLLSGDLVGRICVRDATSRVARDLVAADFIRIGEAAFSIDPLSSQGIQRAILSAVPAMTFFRDRQQQAALQANRRAAQFYRDAGSGDRSRFWTDRSAASEPPAIAAPALLLDMPPVLPPFVRLSDQLQVVDIPALAGAVIKPTAALSHPRLEHPVAYLGGVPLAPLAGDLAAVSATQELLMRWERRMPRPTALHILRWMCAVEILVADGTTAGAAAARSRHPY